MQINFIRFIIIWNILCVCFSLIRDEFLEAIGEGVTLFKYL